MCINALSGVSVGSTVTSNMSTVLIGIFSNVLLQSLKYILVQTLGFVFRKVTNLENHRN